jgi:transposase
MTYDDHTPVPLWARGKCRTSRLWTYVRDDRPFGGPDPPAAVFFYSPDRGGPHPEQHLAGHAGLIQADAYAGFKFPSARSSSCCSDRPQDLRFPS